MKIDIYYFSGTGNSLQIAREIKKRIDQSNLIPIVNLLKMDKIKTNADIVGFIYPLFCLTIPIPLREFLEKVDISSAKYIFAVCTRGGSVSESKKDINKILKKKGKKLNSFLILNMPWNHPLGKKDLTSTATKDEINRLNDKNIPKIDEFCQIVLNKENYNRLDTEVILPLPKYAKIMMFFIPKSLDNKLHAYMYQEKIKFYADSSCTGCGICEKVCLKNRIKMEDKKPIWQEQIKCYGCFACINYCPHSSVQIRSKFPVKSYTEVNGRYHHPDITFKDIAKQKQ